MNAAQALTLAEYNRWANGRLLRAAARLAPEQLHAPCWLSQGSLFRTLIHLADAQWSWRLALQEGRMPGYALTEEQFPDFQSLRAYQKQEDDLLAAYAGALQDAQVEAEVEFSWSSARPRRRPLWQVLLHILNHGTHHRSEAGQYMATLGVSPGNLDFILYVAKERS